MTDYLSVSGFALALGYVTCFLWRPFDLQMTLYIPISVALVLTTEVAGVAILRALPARCTDCSYLISWPLSSIVFVAVVNLFFGDFGNPVWKVLMFVAVAVSFYFLNRVVEYLDARSLDRRRQDATKSPVTMKSPTVAPSPVAQRASVSWTRVRVREVVIQEISVERD
jgi:hypothetical protein